MLLLPQLWHSLVVADSGSVLCVVVSQGWPLHVVQVEFEVDFGCQLPLVDFECQLEVDFAHLRCETEKHLLLLLLQGTWLDSVLVDFEVDFVVDFLVEFVVRVQVKKRLLWLK